MNEEQMKAIFSVAGIKVLGHWELMNEYWPRLPAYFHYFRDSPWWLVKTCAGNVVIGWRKRVISIDWSDTLVRQVATKDDVTKEDWMVHAYSSLKATEYLAALADRLNGQVVAEDLGLQLSK